MTSKVRIVKCPRCRKVLAEPSDVLLYECGGCGAILQAKKRNNSTVDTASQRPESPDEHSSEKLKLDRAFGDQEAGSSSNQQPVLNSTNEPDQNGDRVDLHSSNKDQEAAKKAVEEYSNGTSKMKQLSDNQEPCCSSNQQPLVNSSDEHEPDQITHNEPRSSTEFSGHEDPESSPEATPHNIIEQEHDQDQNQNENITVQLEDPSSKQQFEQLSDNSNNNETDTESLPEDITNSNVNRHETEFVSCRNEIGVEESDSEFEEATVNTRVISDSDGGSKSSFKNMIAEKLLDTRQKKPVYLDEDELLSEDGSANLRHRKRFGRVSSVESVETAQLAGTSYYGYEGSVSSFDGTEDQGPGKKHIGSIQDEPVNSGNWHRFNRRSEFRPLSGRLGKDEHRSVYSLNEFHKNPRHRSQMIPENPKMERIELLKLVQELQDQLERTNVSNPNPNLQQVPSYYNHVLNNAGRHGQRMAFSGEATAVNRRRDAGSCHHCCPQGRHFSAQLPRQHVCCNRPSYGPDTYHSQHFSGPSSPKHNYSESEFSAPDDHWQPNEVMKPKKQYVRPIAGGSPWVACYRCFKLLQLPQSFLLFNKRYHSIRCGSCMKVLNFTLTNGTHVSRYYPEETIAAPPSSEAEDFDKLTGPWAGPVSCSDRSFEKSYSTETDRNGSQFSEDRRKATMSRDPSGSTRPPSSRVSGRRTTTSEIEEVEPEHRPGTNGSPLHWLMGYASPSKVIRGL